jgi:hypothetical protein
MNDEKCASKGKAKLNWNGEFVKAFPICRDEKLDRRKKEVDWQSYRLIGEAALSFNNMFHTHLNTKHLTESEIGLELEVEKQVFKEKL